MKANELRKENIVYNLNEVYKLDSQDIYLIDNDNSIAKRFKPINLTEEWLIKLGFEKTIHSYYHIKEISFYICPLGNDLLVKSFGMDVLTRVKYVHQLQSLYFTLTGEELTC